MPTPIGGASNVGNSQVTQIQDNAASGDFSMPSAGSGDMQYYMHLMEQMQAESRAYQAYSNILTTRHEAAMSAVRNMKG
jgi:hypothetical protein